MQLHILYWNVANSKENAEAALRESSGPDIVAIQEPHVNRNNNAVYCNELYHRIYDSGRATLYIHKRHAIAAWTQRAGTDWCSATFDEGDDSLTIWSIYSEGYKDGDWQSPLTTLSRRL